MSNLLRIINRHFPEAYEAVIYAAREAGTEAFLIGASAFAVHFALEQKPSRGTKDIDFAVYINDVAQYNQIKNVLKLAGFNETIEPFTLYHSNWNTAIDVMPYGPMEQKGIVRFLERESELVVVGFEQVAENTEELNIENQDYRVSTLAGIVLLKSIAYMDRPEHRRQDIDDILQVCSSYFELKTDYIYNKHLEILTLFNPNKVLFKSYVGATCISKEINQMIKNAPSLVLEKLNRILQPEVQRHIKSIWAGKINDEEGANTIFNLLYQLK